MAPSKAGRGNFRFARPHAPYEEHRRAQTSPAIEILVHDDSWRGFAAALIAAAVAAETSSDSAGVLVRTRQGMIAGLTLGKVEQFRGVPYAAPPLADLRWRAPLAPKPYSGTLQATKFPAPCVQGRVAADLPTPSEDCLYLNLYRPAGSKEGKKMPVLIYFHGGGFAAGTGSARDGVDLAAGNDMIVIMPNYRLGSLGWLGLSQLDAETAERFVLGKLRFAGHARFAAMDSGEYRRVWRRPGERDHRRDIRRRHRRLRAPHRAPSRTALPSRHHRERRVHAHLRLYHQPPNRSAAGRQVCRQSGMHRRENFHLLPAL